MNLVKLFPITFLLTLLLNNGYSQHIFEEKKHNCNYKGMSLENSKITVEFSSYEDLYRALTKDVEDKFLMKVMGKVMMQIVIDSEGNSCCISISNNTNVSSSKLKLFKNINSLTGWKSLSENRNSKTCILLSLNYAKEHVTLERLGSNVLGEATILDTYHIDKVR